MKKGCLLSLLIWGALGAGYYFYFNGRYEPPADWIGAIVGSLLSLFGIGAIRNIHLQLIDRRLIKGASRARIPRNRELIAVFGKIQSIGEPLLSPFTHTPCVLFSYEIFDRYSQRVGTGSNRRTETRTDKFISGFQMKPCSIRSSIDEVKLFGFPILDDFPEVTVQDPAAPERARAFIANTKFEDMGGLKITKVFGEMKDIFSDVDGTIEKNWKMKELSSLDGLYFQEQLVPDGEELCALGIYDPTKNGLVIDMAAGRPLRFIRGKTDDALAKIKSSIIGYIIMAIFFLGIGNAILFFVLHQHSHSDSQVRERTERFIRALDDNDIGKISEMSKFPIDMLNSNNPSSIPLMKARSREAAGIILEMGSPINMTDPNGRTALMRAIENKFADLAKYLIERGADINIKDKWGETALTIADSNGQTEIAEILRKAGAYDELVTRSNGTPVTTSSPAFKVCVDYLNAIQREDVSTLKQLFIMKTPDTFDDVDFDLWKRSRPINPVIVEGFENNRRATIMITDKSVSNMLWRYQLLKDKSGWKIEKERWVR